MLSVSCNSCAISQYTQQTGRNTRPRLMADRKLDRAFSLFLQNIDFEFVVLDGHNDMTAMLQFAEQ